MIILGIETSCDETACAIVENLSDGRKVKLKVLSSIIASSEDLHKKTGGIIPENAARKQIEYIIPVIQKALDTAFPNISLAKQIASIDAIAVTYGPGLIGSLLVGVETARTLSYLWNKPLIKVNHLVAHLYANWLNNGEQWSVNNDQINRSNSQPEFPLLGLVVSGGHTDLVLMKEHGKVKWIGGTRDDASGEAFDKTARLLGLPYPGGPAISKEAKKYLLQHPKSAIRNLDLFPRPMINSKDFDWSFSGLKTSVLNYTKNNTEINIQRIAAEIQEAIVDVLVQKSIHSIEVYKPKSFVLGGGVSANSRLKEKFISALGNCKMKTSFHVPAVINCTDNAAVIASCAFFNQSTISWKEISANPELAITD